MAKNRRSLSLVTKFTILICAVVLTFLSTGIAITYFSISDLLREREGQAQAKMADLIASNIVQAGDTVVDVEALSGYINNFKLGDTGYAALVDDKAYLVSAKGAIPYNNKFCSYDELQRILERGSRWGLMDDVYGCQGTALVSFSFVEHPLLSKKGVKWIVFVSRDVKEVFKPLYGLIIKKVMFAGILIILLVVVGIVLGRLFVRPIRKLNESLEHIGSGNLDYRLSINCSDEIGQLADSFNRMIEGLSRTTTSMARLEKEISVRQSAEEKVRRLALEWGRLIELAKDNASKMKDGDDLSRLIGGAGKLIEMTKLESGEIEMDIKPINIRDLIRSVVLELEPKIREKGLDLRLDIPKTKITVLGDHERIKQVLTILINNAIKFTNKGHITISVRELKHAVECVVADSGFGILKTHLSKIFEGCNHLNLSIAKYIVDKHRGRIWAESEPGKLTKFIFELPA